MKLLAMVLIPLCYGGLIFFMFWVHRTNERDRKEQIERIRQRHRSTAFWNKLHEEGEE